MCLQGFRRLPRKTASLRDEETNLLIATIKPRKKEAASTFYRWLKDALQLKAYFTFLKLTLKDQPST